MIYIKVTRHHLHYFPPDPVQSNKKIKTTEVQLTAPEMLKRRRKITDKHWSYCWTTKRSTNISVMAEMMTGSTKSANSTNWIMSTVITAYASGVFSTFTEIMLEIVLILNKIGLKSRGWRWKSLWNVCVIYIISISVGTVLTDRYEPWNLLISKNMLHLLHGTQLQDK